MKTSLLPRLGVLAALGAAAFVPAASANQAQLSYVGYIAGAPVLNLSADITVPEGTKPGDGAYRIAADIATMGNLAVLYPYTQSLQATGALKAGKARPAKYNSTIRIWQRQETVTLTYAPNGAVGIEAVPLTRQAQMAKEQGYAHGTMDPASLVVAVASLFAKAGSCEGTYQLFDGVRRYDLSLAQGGYADLVAMPNSYYDGSATECIATPQLVAGFQQSALNASLYPQSARLWMAPAIAGFPTVPVRIKAQSAFGEVTLELVQVTK
ncbi:DUF3108 domain-containing protein [Dongia deserti]|uniref:DUF3108 domain-containing protein n=1 Tax=Dongia deserti TaxID=2268030 RepID=UPI000E655002|nr:DUF3108 domain-containing protein [Dongia deserti]